MALAQELFHPFSLAFALNYAAWLYQLRREQQAAQEQAEATTDLIEAKMLLGELA